MYTPSRACLLIAATEKRVSLAAELVRLHVGGNGNVDDGTAELRSHDWNALALSLSLCRIGELESLCCFLKRCRAIHHPLECASSKSLHKMCVLAPDPTSISKSLSILRPLCRTTPSSSDNGPVCSSECIRKLVSWLLQPLSHQCF